ncbi:MAG: hypothetical protein IKN43_10205 [Selenomonadaceae bacterium]|nr:hypothetical protein [Selenomonadaceae bacterium]
MKNEKGLMNLAHELQQNNYIQNIKNRNFITAYIEYPLQGEISITERPLMFMKDVINEFGTEPKTIQSAIEAVTDCQGESPKFMEKLLQDTVNTEEYQKYKTHNNLVLS